MLEYRRAFRLTSSGIRNKLILWEASMHTSWTGLILTLFSLDTQKVAVHANTRTTSHVNQDISCTMAQQNELSNWFLLPQKEGRAHEGSLNTDHSLHKNSERRHTKRQKKAEVTKAETDVSPCSLCCKHINKSSEMDQSHTNIKDIRLFTQIGGTQRLLTK